MKFGLQFEITGSPKLQHGAVILILLLCIKDAHVYHFGELLDMFQCSPFFSGVVKMSMIILCI